MTGGYTGKILRLNLTNGTVSTMDTSKYEEWGGGHGIGSAIFWDLAVAPGNWDLQDGFDPRNVVTIMASPLAGTLSPSQAESKKSCVQILIFGNSGSFPSADHVKSNVC